MFLEYFPTMRAGRLLSVLLLLQSRGRMTATELAEELEVSVRTIHRDIEALSGSGVPVYAERGAAGGFRLLDGYSTKLTGLTEAEARSLLFSGIPGAATELGLGQVLAAAELKVSAALPGGLRTRADQVRQRFLLDQRAWFRTSEEVPHLIEIADAVWAQHRIRVRYRRWDGSIVTRTLRPLGLVLKAGVWYLIALARHGEPRMYRVSRVHRVHTLEQSFDRPEDFDLREYWFARDEELRSRLYQGYAVVRLSARARRMLHLLSAIPLGEHQLSTLLAEPDGWTTVRLPIESHEHAVAQFLQLGAGCEILEPVELRERVIAELAAMGQVYGAGEAPTTLSRRPS